MANSIKAIDKKSVHRICSGQVVLTLATAVKELIENSIDASATIIDIKLKEYGSESIEVSDNGIGIEKDNFQGLTLKHHTSKIQDFEDVVGVETFGFRGEALSSLCALSNLSVVTRHQDVSVATKLEYDTNGKIMTQSSQARQVGTTVTLKNLFYSLPVRHKEFQRNLKKEFAKMVQVVSAYCIINTGVKISCTNQLSSGARPVVCSKGNSNLKENIGSVFGAKQLNSLMEFVQENPTEEIAAEFNLKKIENEPLFHVEGFISNCSHGQGRGATDRQFYFINKRPCDPSKISKIVNEVYHQYNKHQYPFVALSIGLNKECVDVNVTPDKRQIFLQDESLLLAIIKSSLLKMFEPTSSILPCQIIPNLSKSATFPSPSKQMDCKGDNQAQALSSLSKLKRSFSSAFAKNMQEPELVKIKSPEEQKSKQRKLDMFIKQDCQPVRDVTLINKVESSDESKVFVTEHGDGNKDSDCELQFVKEENSDSKYSNSSKSDTLTNSANFSQKASIVHHISNVKNENSFVIGNAGEKNSRINGSFYSTKDTKSRENIEVKTEKESYSSQDTRKINENNSELDLQTFSNILDNGASSVRAHFSLADDAEAASDANSNGPSQEDKEDHIDLGETSIDQDESFEDCEWDKKEQVERKEKQIKFSFQALKSKFAKRKESVCKSDEDFHRVFRARINPTENQAAEEELNKAISKDMFANMEILGQFNLGFIITKHGEDLFIVDQHATDEKYNFEMLQRHTVIQSQKLIHPQCLELTVANETILMDDLEIFKKNGFDFIVEEDAPPSERVKLIAKPASKNWLFGKDDIVELIFMLTDSPGVMCRPTRVRAMFASRACRKSVMIGTALNKSEMKKLVCHMGEIEQPWNCPHGRPTMRHLINLKMVPR